MESKPKNISEAIDKLGHFADSTTSDLKSKLQNELHALEEQIRDLKPHLEELQKKAGDEARQAKVKIEKKVSENPWASIGIVGLVFFILGLLFASRGGRRND